MELALRMRNAAAAAASCTMRAHMRARTSSSCTHQPIDRQRLERQQDARAHKPDKVHALAE